jgi:hypothetical protein
MRAAKVEEELEVFEHFLHGARAGKAHLLFKRACAAAESALLRSQALFHRAPKALYAAVLPRRTHLHELLLHAQYPQHGLKERRLENTGLCCFKRSEAQVLEMLCPELW